MSGSRPDAPKRPNKLDSHTLIDYSLRSILPKVVAVEEKPRFPNVAYLEGDYSLGKAREVFDCDGQGSDRIVVEAAKLAETTQGRCQWRFGPRTWALMISTAADFETLQRVHVKADHLILHDSTGSFEGGFGRSSTFAQAFKTEAHKNRRGFIQRHVFTEKALNEAEGPMRNIILRKVLTFSERRSTDLKKVASRTALEMIGTVLGFTKMSDADKDNLNETVQAGVRETATQWNQMVKHYTYNWLPDQNDVSKSYVSRALDYIPKGYGYYPKKLFEFGYSKWLGQFHYREAAKNIYKGMFGPTEFDTILSKGNVAIRKMLENNEENILSTKNMLNPNGKGSEVKSADLYSQYSFELVKELLIAGSETSATLLLFSMMLLADPKNKAVLDKLRKELADLKKSPQEWTRQDLKKLSYLIKIIMETLRLYAPVPDMVFGVAKEFQFAGGTLTPNDVIVVPLRKIHCEKAMWGEDANDFRPERFDEDSYTQNPLKDYMFSPFGIKERECVGQNFARLDALFTLATLFYYFDIEFDQGKKFEHPIESHQVFTRSIEAESVPVKFVVREEMKAELERLRRHMESGEREQKPVEEPRQREGLGLR